MRDYEQSDLREKILQICDLNKLENRRIYLWGAGDFSRNICYILKEKNLVVDSIIDNDKSKQGGFCAGIPIVGLDDVLNLGKEEKLAFVLCSDFWVEIVKQLEDKKIPKESIFVSISFSKFLFQALIFP